MDQIVLGIFVLVGGYSHHIHMVVWNLQPKLRRERRILIQLMLGSYRSFIWWFVSDLLSKACVDLTGLVQTVAEYIFTNMLSMEEQLINHDVIQATWEVLHAIAPRCRFLDDIMTLVPCMLTYEERLTSVEIMCWFIPYNFVRRVFNFNLTPQKAAKEYKLRFLSTITMQEQ